MLIVLAGGMLAAAVFDLRARRIPDVLNLALGLAGLAVNAGRHGLPGLAWAGLGLSAALLFTLAPFARRALGG
ncbi:MAG: prepilin peptidase, partial [Myxococcales bacterium]|nr:prepilin peptidase [Myxococcales bacterium]